MKNSIHIKDHLQIIGSATLVIAILIQHGTLRAETFLAPGKWMKNRDDSYICVPPNNIIPTETALAIQFAANFSTGDGRWVGKCSTKKLERFGDSFKATIKCNQTRTKNGIKVSYFPIVSARIDHQGRYLVQQKMAYFSKKSDVFTDIYSHISTSCELKTGYKSLVMPAAISNWSRLDPDFVNLLGFPAGSIYVP